MKYIKKIFYIKVYILTCLITSFSNALTTTDNRFIGDGDGADFSIEVAAGQATLYLAHKPSNEPFTKARVSFSPAEGNKTLTFTETQSPGVYKTELVGVELNRGQILLESSDQTDAIEVKSVNLQIVTNSKPLEKPSFFEGKMIKDVWFIIGAFFLGGIAGSGILAGLRRLRKNNLLIIILLPLLGDMSFQSKKALAHGGHDHAGGNIESADLGSGITLSKKSQFLIEIKNIVAKKETLPEVLSSYGHTIPNPQQDALITAPQTGFFRSSVDLLLGRKVRLGEKLGYLESTNQIPLTTPIVGKIIDIYAVDGTRVEAGAKLFRITNTSKIWVDAKLFSSDLEKFKLSSKAFVEIEGNNLGVEAKILKGVTLVSEETRTAKVFLELDNTSDDLIIGRFARISFLLNSSSVGFSVPRSAILNYNGDNIVIIQTGPETFAPREIVLKQGSKPGTVIITKGINEGDRIVVSGNYQLLMKVK